jgi:hypothetical protein
VAISAGGVAGSPDLGDVLTRLLELSLKSISTLGVGLPLLVGLILLLGPILLQSLLEVNL